MAQPLPNRRAQCWQVDQSEPLARSTTTPGAPWEWKFTGTAAKRGFSRLACLSLVQVVLTPFTHPCEATARLLRGRWQTDGFVFRSVLFFPRHGLFLWAHASPTSPGKLAVTAFSKKRCPEKSSNVHRIPQLGWESSRSVRSLCAPAGCPEQPG